MRKLMYAILLVAIFSVAMAAYDHIPNVEVMYYHKVNLTCMNDDLDPDTSRQQLMWLLPSGDIVKNDEDHDRVIVFENGKHIHIKKLDDEDFGVYNCIIYSNTQEYQIIQKGINLNGPYWGDLMAKYRTNVIVGAIAAAVVLVIMLGMCYCMNRGRNLDEDESERVKAADLWLSNRNVYDNNAAELADIQMEPKKVPPVNGDSPPGYSDNSESLATKL